MRDFPVFTTDYGVASLVLKEVPYRQEAYITIQAAIEPDALLHECVSFCRMVGAEKIYAKGHEILSRFPLHTTVNEMKATAWVDKEKMECLFPVTEATVSQWRQIYNERMRNVDNAGTLEAKDEKRIAESGGAYFVHRGGQLLGIGLLEDTKLLAVASVQKGAGERVMHTLMSLIEGADMTLEVASTNERAIRLYEKLGFLKTTEISKWYCVF
jgi:ribosomal protein S18 acetylase RimI-like enzyme